MSFVEANQARLKLKMKLHNYSWYMGSHIASDPEGYIVVVTVKQLDNQVRKLISPVMDGVSVRTEVG